MPAPESTQKSADAKKDAKQAAAKKRLTKPERRTRNLKEVLKRAAKYDRQYRTDAQRLVSLRKQAEKLGDKGGFYLEAEAKVALVIRIRGIMDIAPKPKKILELLRLKGIFNATFVRINKASLEMLKRVAPYVAWGYPSLSTIKKLITKRGYGKVKGQRIRLSNNSLIQKALGKHNIVCLDDIIHQIHTVGPKFREVNNFIWPFKLSCPSGGLKQKRRHFIDRGDFGNRETYINPFVKRMI